MHRPNGATHATRSAVEPLPELGEVEALRVPVTEPLPPLLRGARCAGRGRDACVVPGQTAEVLRGEGPRAVEQLLPNVDRLLDASNDADVMQPAVTEVVLVLAAVVLGEVAGDGNLGGVRAGIAEGALGG